MGHKAFVLYNIGNHLDFNKTFYAFVQTIHLGDIQMEILKSLIQIRRANRVNQKTILNSLGVNATTLSRYENGQREMPFKVLERYADYLGYEIRLLKK